MNDLTTLFFADTTLDPKIAAQLLFVFDKIYHYQPSEPVESVGEDEDFLCRQLIKNGLCQGYPPVPFGSELEQFKRTLKDLQTHWGDYGNRLPHLSLASMSTREPLDEDEASINRLAAAFQKKNSPTDQGISNDRTEGKDLWQARLVLKLAELLDRAERELEQGLTSLANRERDMLKSLRGSDEDDLSDGFSASALLKNSPAHPPVIRQKMKAWTQLFLAEQKTNHPLTEHWLITTNREEPVAMFFETYTKLFKRQPTVLFTIPLPNLSGEDLNNYIGKRASFRAGADKSFAIFKDFLTKSASHTKHCPTDKPDTDTLNKAVTEWETATRHAFPDTSLSCSLLTFYCFSAAPLNMLLASTFHLAATSQCGQIRYPNGLVAALTSAI